MLNLVPVLSSILPVIAAGLVALVLLINLYSKIRQQFLWSVNCWFCNSWTKVAYNQRDGFDCPTCLQYNGFGKDGGYNKIIPEQHDELLNKSNRGKSKTGPAANGLCTLCNNNQQLKIFQLANFVPMVEENYDAEIEHFQQQLEKAYKLCRKCDRVLKSTIDKQNAWLFGNRLKNLYKKGVSSLNSYTNRQGAARDPLFLRLHRVASVLVALVTLLDVALLNLRLFSRYVPRDYAPLVKDLMTLANASKFVEIDTSQLPTSVKIESYTLLCGTGLLLQLISTVWDGYSATVKANRLLCWVILLLMSWIRPNKSYLVYILFSQISCCCYLLYSAVCPGEKSQHSLAKGKRKSMRKLVKNLEYTCSDFSDADEDFGEISTSSKKSESAASTGNSHSNQSNWGLPLPSLRPNTANSPLNESFGPANSTFTTARGVSPHNFEPLSSTKPFLDINSSLNNLHLGGLTCKSPTRVASPVFSVTSVNRPRPVLSPPKLQTVNQNSWVAGGFWRNIDGVIMPVSQTTNLSRSSSESSGFGSQHNENLNAGYFNPPSSFNKPFDRFSVVSEPAYLLKPFQGVQKPPHNQHMFYPNLHQNNMLFIQGSRSFMTSPNYTSPINVSFPEPLIENRPYQRDGLFQNNWSDRLSTEPMASFRNLRLGDQSGFIPK